MYVYMYICVCGDSFGKLQKKKKKLVNFNFIHKSISYQVRLGHKLFS